MYASSCLEQDHCVDLGEIAAQVQHHTAQLYHLRAGINKLATEIDALIGSLETAQRGAADVQRTARCGPAPGALREELTEADARQQLAEFGSLIDTLEGAARSVMGQEATVAAYIELPCEPAQSDAQPEIDDLLQIRGLTADDLEALEGLGFHTFAHIANLSADDVSLLSAVLGDSARISKDCWIEQAALLADGVETAHLANLRHSADKLEIAPLKLVKPTAADFNAAIPDAQTIELRSREEGDDANFGHAPYRVIEAAMDSSRNIGRRMMLAAAAAALIVGIQTAPIDLKPTFVSPQLQLLAQCGRAVMAGNAGCASLMWSKL